MMRKHNYLVLRNNLNQGIYFIYKKDAEEFIRICKQCENNKKAKYEIVKF